MAEVIQRTWRSGPRKVRRSSWGYTAMIDGRQVRKYHAAWSKEDAQNALAARLIEGETPPTPTPKTLAEVGREYLDFKRAKGKRTVAEDAAKLARFEAFFGAVEPITAITAQRIAGYERQRVTETSKRGRVVSPATVNRELAMLRHLLRLVEEWGYITKAPRIRMGRESEGRLRWLTPGEAGRLLHACRESRSKPLAAIVTVALNTGARKAEILSLTWDRVDFARGVLRFDKTKSGRRREVPMNGAVYDALSAVQGVRQGPVFCRRDGAAWGNIRTAFEGAVEVAGLDNLVFHDLRHTCASWLVQRGRSLKEVQELLGHQTIAMTMRYSHLSPDRLREAVAALDAPMFSTTSAQEAVESSERLVTSRAPVAQLDRASDF
jgi:integrase